ncbi:MAG: insulinase family protein [Enterobacteriaceae bacterium]|jgi:zinc protease|nr:insulinase family protein [Enterobacteriaceae bacterium]
MIKIIRTVLLSFAVMMMCVLRVSADASTDRLPDDGKLIRGQLKNGMTYMIYPHPNPAGQVNFWLQIHAGALQEEDDQRGVAHFVEHMLFNGTRDYPANKVIETYESIGLKFGKDVNAYTDYRETVYQVNMPSNNPKNLDLVMNILMNQAALATFAPEEVDAERGVVTEEWRANQGLKWRNSEARRPYLLANTRNQVREPIGLMDIVAKVTPQRLKDFYQRWYTPDNMTLMISGDISQKQAEELIQKTFASLESAPHAKKDVYMTLPVNQTRFNVIKDKENTVNSFSLFYRFPVTLVTTEADFIQQTERNMLLQLFNQRMQDRLHAGELPNTLGSMARQVSVADDYQAIFFRTAAKNENLKQAAEVLLGELARIDKDGFTQIELDNLKTSQLAYLKQAKLESDNRDARMLMSRLAMHSLDSTPVISPDLRYQLAEQLWQNITLKTLHDQWKALRSTQDRFFEQIVTDKMKKPLSEKQVLTLEKQLENAPVKTYIPRPTELTLSKENSPAGTISTQKSLSDSLTEMTLSNGAKVLLVKPDDAASKRMQILAYINRGALSFPASQSTLVALADKAASGSGLGRLTASELKQWNAKHATTLSSTVDNRSTLISVSVSATDPEAGFELMNQRFLAPNVNAEVLELMKQSQKNVISTLNLRPEDQFVQSVYQARYDDPRTHLANDAQFASLTQTEALHIARQLLADPKSVTFIISSNLSQDDLTPFIEQWLAGIPEVKENVLPPITPLKLSLKNQTIKQDDNREPVAQVVEYRNYKTDNKLNEPTRLALEAWNFALARDLRVNVREQASGVYSVRSKVLTWPDYDYTGYTVSFSCEPARAQSLLDLVHRVTEQRQNKGITQSELDEFKTITMRSLQMQKQNTAQTARLLMQSYALYGSPVLYLEAEQALKALTVDDVNKIAAKYFATQESQINGMLLPKGGK